MNIISEGGNILSHASQLAKKPRELTPVDKQAFKIYATVVKDFKSGIKPSEQEEIFNQDGLSFLSSVYEFICKKLKIPQPLKPMTTTGKVVSTNAAAEFDYTDMSINISNEIFNLHSKAQIFGKLRHEFQHFLQNLDIYRHETLGKEAVDFYAQLFTKVSRNRLETFFKIINLDEARLTMDEKAFQELSQMKRLMETDRVGYEKCWENEFKLIQQQLAKYRETVIAEMGIIEKNSPQAKEAEKYFDDFKNMNYFNEDHSIDLVKYESTFVEQEAMFAENVWQSEAEKKCVFSVIRDQLLQLEELQQSNPELAQRIMGE